MQILTVISAVSKPRQTKGKFKKTTTKSIIENLA